jgi:hypothetical protein
MSDGAGSSPTDKRSREEEDDDEEEISPYSGANAVIASNLFRSV